MHSNNQRTAGFLPSSNTMSIGAREAMTNRAESDMLTPGTIISEMEAPTWAEVTTMYPEFVQWVVQRKGGTPTGPILGADWEKWRSEYLRERGGDETI